MKYNLLVSIFALSFIFISVDSKMIDYFVNVNGVHCSMLSFQADISVLYNTKEGIKSANISFENTTNMQSGVCETRSEYNTAQFNISIDKKDTLVFNFHKVDNIVFLKNIQFVFNLPNIKFPNALDKGTLIASEDMYMYLSNSSEYYQCMSKKTINLSKGVTFNVYAIKLKVFNVENNSFGDSLSQCPQDNSKPTKRMPTKSTIISARKTTSRKTIINMLKTPIITTKTTPLKSTTNKSTRSIKTTRTTPRKTTRSMSTRSTRTILTTTTSPKDPKFVIKGETICLLVQSKMNLSVSYETKKTIISRLFTITSKTLYDGKCAKDKENLNIYISDNIFFTLSFTKKGEKVKLNKFKTHIYLSPKFFPDAKYQNKTLRSSTSFGSDYEVEVNKSYSCMNKLTFGNNTLKLDLLDFKFEAFKTSNTEDFSKNVITCKSKDSSYSKVGMIVGIVIAVIVAISIILFIIYRIYVKKNQGYEKL